MSLESSAKIEVDQQHFSIEKLTPYGFTAKMPYSIGDQKEGRLDLRGQLFDVKFRVRDRESGGAACSFDDLSTTNQGSIRKFLADLQRGIARDSALGARNDDELAPDGIGNGEAEEAVVARSETSNFSSDSALVSEPDTATNVAPSRGGVKSFAKLLMFLAMLLLLILGFYFLRSRSRLEIENSSLVGNFLPVTASVEGEVVQLNVSEGELVSKGDVLMKLKNQTMQVALENAKAQLATAESKVIALKKQRSSYESKITVASEKLSLDLQVATSELEAADKSRQATLAAVNRLKPFVESGAVTQVEFDVAEKEQLDAEASYIASKNRVKLVEFAKKMANSGVLIVGDRIDDEKARLESEIEIAEAELKEMRVAKEICERQVAALNVVAPRDGQVYVTYRQVGEFLKVADQAIALSYEGKVWAAGQVSASQASRVRPGQSVTIRIPLTGERLEGCVTAVGHRAVYPQGGYAADFRGATATDIPVKVMINKLPEKIPAGIRLEMAITTGFGIAWLDKTLGYQLQPAIDSVKEQQATPITPVTEHVKSPNLDSDIEGIVDRMGADQ